MTLTRNDLHQIEVLISKIIEEKFKNLPTKEEFFSKTNELIRKSKMINGNRKFS